MLRAKCILTSKFDPDGNNKITLCIFCLNTRYTHTIFCAPYCFRWPDNLSGCAVFFVIIAYAARFGEKMCMTWSVYIDFLYNFYLKIFVFREEFSQISQNLNPLDVKFHEKPSSGSRVIARGRTDVTKPRVAFCNFTNVSENETCVSSTRLALVFVQLNRTGLCSDVSE